MFIVPVSRHAMPTLRAARGYERLVDDALEHLFGAPRTPARNDEAPVRRPSLDIAENAQHYVVMLDVPGVVREDIQVAVDGRQVSIVAEARKADAAPADAPQAAPGADPASAGQPASTPSPASAERVILRERTSARFARSFALPTEIDQAASQAKLDNGVLTLTLVKRHPSAARLTVN